MLKRENRRVFVSCFSSFTNCLSTIQTLRCLFVTLVFSRFNLSHRTSRIDCVYRLCHGMNGGTIKFACLVKLRIRPWILVRDWPCLSALLAFASLLGPAVRVYLV